MSQPSGGNGGGGCGGIGVPSNGHYQGGRDYTTCQRRRRSKHSRSADPGGTTTTTTTATTTGSSNPRFPPPHQAPLPCSDFDVAYFNSYAHLGVHEEMIKDRVRTEAYRNAILQYEDQIKGKVVLDVGCGTGILSIFCAQAGAARVYAVDASKIALQAHEVIKENDLLGTVLVMHGRIEDVELPEKVDVIISEWMGYMLLYESMLGSVIAARDKWLRPGGLILPAHATLYMAPVSNPDRYNDSVNFWRNVYGINMSAMMPLAKQCAFEEPSVETISGENILTWPHVVKHIDCYTVTSSELESVTSKFKFKSMMRAHFHGFAFWFDVDFGEPVLSVPPLTTIHAISVPPLSAIPPIPAPPLSAVPAISVPPLSAVPPISVPPLTVVPPDNPVTVPLTRSIVPPDIPMPTEVPRTSDAPMPTEVPRTSDAPMPKDEIGTSDTPKPAEVIGTSDTSKPAEVTGTSDTSKPAEVTRMSDTPMPDPSQRKKRRTPHDVLVLSTAPEDPPTHWQQTLVYFFEPIPVEQDQSIDGTVTLSQSLEHARFMNIHLEYETAGHCYVKESTMR